MTKTAGSVLESEPLHRTRNEINALLQETRSRITADSLEEQRLEAERRAIGLEMRPRRPQFSVRRTVFERFTILRESFNVRIAARVGELRRFPRTNNPLLLEVLGNLLGQVSLAQRILASLDPALIGGQDHEEASRELGDLRRVLFEMLHESAEAPCLADPGPSERAPAARPEPPSEEAPVLELELSPWAMGSWGMLPR